MGDKNPKKQLKKKKEVVKTVVQPIAAAVPTPAAKPKKH
jgi:hypothetical protein